MTKRSEWRLTRAPGLITKNALVPIGNDVQLPIHLSFGRASHAADLVHDV